MAKSVFALVQDADRAGEVLKALQGRGIFSDNVSVLFADKRQTRDFAKVHSTHTEGAAEGATVGSVVGSALGVTAFLGSLVVPGLGIFMVSGPLMVLFGAMAGAAIGGLGGALRGLGLPSAVAEFYAHQVQDGRVLMAVDSDTMQGLESARQVLTDLGGDEIYATVQADADYTRGPSRA
jgi:hypothetical protein